MDSRTSAIVRGAPVRVCTASFNPGSVDARPSISIAIDATERST
jgi:hypothetical protein